MTVSGPGEGGGGGSLREKEWVVDWSSKLNVAKMAWTLFGIKSTCPAPAKPIQLKLTARQDVSTKKVALKIASCQCENDISFTQIMKVGFT